ncbi:MAG: bifunctional diaminohydroxyphosphoribosylaminopyrimidine deaminase/5-amino-6-(5-phosphoribosylamino)uracil reductase RibD [Saprospiraceae bacterium]|nr:bifunctional diaminohydroxyphosphoribosylaminopyrimidine deaminase/5-amino-6-(5-phosphoribosylamino)uracil reductase RibD [Saprospiraceae bacterium]
MNHTPAESWMKRCFALARRGEGLVSPNPMVGAVLVHENRVIGEGWHQKWGGPHAEVFCFQSVKPEDRQKIKESTLYCSLEPCSHFGKTPPCADLILQFGVPQVVVANVDPNPLVAGAGLKKLQDHGVIVQSEVLASEGAWLNRAFFTWIQYQRPYVVLKWAETADGFISKKGERTAISNAVSRRLSHRWRAAADVILIGANTAITDDPELTTRYYFGKDPLRVLLDWQGSTPIDAKLFQDQSPCLIFGKYRAGLNEFKRFVEGDGPITMPELLQSLRKESCTVLLVEGGANVHQKFLDAGIWDEIRIIQSPESLGAGVAAPVIPFGVYESKSFQLGSDTVQILLSGRRG